MLVGLERGSVGQLVNRGQKVGQQGPGSGPDKVRQQGSAGLSRVNEARKWVSGGSRRPESRSARLKGGSVVLSRAQQGQWGSVGPESG